MGILARIRVALRVLGVLLSLPHYDTHPVAECNRVSEEFEALKADVG